MNQELLSIIKSAVFGTISAEEAVGMMEESGYAQVDGYEYAAEHRFAGLEFVNEEGELWDDEDEFRDWYSDYGNVNLKRRVVGRWMDLT